MFGNQLINFCSYLSTRSLTCWRPLVLSIPLLPHTMLPFRVCAVLFRIKPKTCLYKTRNLRNTRIKDVCVAQVDTHTHTVNLYTLTTWKRQARGSCGGWNRKEGPCKGTLEFCRAETENCWRQNSRDGNWGSVVPCPEPVVRKRQGPVSHEGSILLSQQHLCHEWV